MITASSMKASLAKQIFVSLCLRLSHLVQIIQCWRNTLHRKWTARTAVELNTRDERFTALCSSCRQKDSKGGNFRVFFFQRTAWNSSRVLAARAPRVARLFFFIPLIKMLICGVVVAGVVVDSKAS